MIRKKRFGIPVKLSLTVAFIVVTSFLFIFAFFQKTQREELRQKMRDELSLKVDNLQQDIINYAFQLQTGDFRLPELQKKLTTLYEQSFTSDNQLAEFNEIAYINKEGKIIAHSTPSLKMRSFLNLEKRRLTKDEYQKFLRDWVNIRISVTEEPFVSFLQRKQEPIFQLIKPIYFNYKNIQGVNRSDLFFDYWENFQQQELLHKIKLSPFFTRTFKLFSLFWENRMYLNQDGKLNDQGKKLLNDFKKSWRRYRRKFSLPYLSFGDFNNIHRSLGGFYYFTEEYWYKRIQEGEKILKASQVMERILDKKVIEEKVRTIQNILLENQENPYEEWRGKLVINILQLKKVYQDTIQSFRPLFPEKRQELFEFFQNIFVMPQEMENRVDEEKALQRYISRKLKVLEWWNDNLNQNLQYLRNLLNDYLEVNLQEEDNVFSKNFLIQSVKSLYQVMIFRSFQADPRNYEKNRTKLLEERDRWLKEIQNNQVLYHPISLRENGKNNEFFTLADKNTLFSFQFFIYLHQYLGIFKKNNGELSDAIQQIVENNIPDAYKNFRKGDIYNLEENVAFLRNWLLKQEENPEKYSNFSLKNILSIEDGILGFQTSFVQDVFQSLVQRYHVGYLLVRVSEEKIREAIRRKNNSLIDLGLNLLIRFLFIAVLLSMFFLKKFRILFRGVEIVGQGNLGYKIRIPGSDEFGQLADHFNGMTSNLQEAQEELVEKSRMEEELKIAERIQQTLLPDSYPDYPSLSFSSYYNAQTETGGDYFDFIRLDDKTLGLVIADVSGHGVGACLVMSMIRTLIRSYAHLTNNPKKLLTQINDYVFEDTPSNMYATLFYGIYNLETHKLVYSIAGHNAGILYHPGKNQMRTLKTGGMAAGVVNSSIFSNVIKNYEVELEPGEIFIQYTDGVTEAEDPEGNLYEMERLLKTVESSKEKKIEDMFQDIIRDIQVFTRGYVQSDDITMMGFQIEEGKK